MSALERLKRLRDHLLSLDSSSREAADLALALAVIEAAQSLSYFPANMVPSKDILKLDDAIAALITDETNGPRLPAENI